MMNLRETSEEPKKKIRRRVKWIIPTNNRPSCQRLNSKRFVGLDLGRFIYYSSPNTLMMKMSYRVLNL